MGIKVYTPAEVGRLFAISEKCAKKYYQVLGGVKIGGKYRFTEEGIRDAIIQQTKKYVASQGGLQGEVLYRNLRDEEGGKGMGDKEAERIRDRVKADPHDIFGGTGSSAS